MSNPIDRPPLPSSRAHCSGNSFSWNCNNINHLFFSQIPPQTHLPVLYLLTMLVSSEFLADEHFASLNYKFFNFETKEPLWKLHKQHNINNKRKKKENCVVCSIVLSIHSDVRTLIHNIEIKWLKWRKRMQVSAYTISEYPHQLAAPPTDISSSGAGQQGEGRKSSLERQTGTSVLYDSSCEGKLFVFCGALHIAVEAKARANQKFPSREKQNKTKHQKTTIERRNNNIQLSSKSNNIIEH